MTNDENYQDYRLFFEKLELIAGKKTFDLTDSIIICGETRSGSTWLMEMLSQIPDTIINWEPLHPKFGVIPQDLKWGDRPYIPEGSEDKLFVDIFLQLLTLQIFSPWTLKYNGTQRALAAKIVLTKFVRANMLLPWIVKNFVFRNKPIFLLRHPIPVALSQFKAFITEKQALTNFEVPDCMNNERFIIHFEYITGLETQLEKKIALWCLNNMNTINHPHNGSKWLTVYYEDLLLNPHSELKRILESLQVDSEHLLDTMNFRKPSSTNFKNTFQSHPDLQLNKWTSVLTAQEKNRIQNVFNHFDVRCYSAFSSVPLKD